MAGNQKATLGNKLYIYRLLRDDIGIGRQEFLPNVEKMLTDDDILPEDMGFESTLQMLQAFDDFVSLTEFKGGRVYVRVTAQEQWDRWLEAAAADKPADRKAKQGKSNAKPWKHGKKTQKVVRPVKPKHRKTQPAASQPEEPVTTHEEQVAKTAPQTDEGVPVEGAPVIDTARPVAGASSGPTDNAADAIHNADQASTQNKARQSVRAEGRKATSADATTGKVAPRSSQEPSDNNSTSQDVEEAAAKVAPRNGTAVPVRPREAPRPARISLTVVGEDGETALESTTPATPHATGQGGDASGAPSWHEAREAPAADEASAQTPASLRPDVTPETSAPAASAQPASSAQKATRAGAADVAVIPGTSSADSSSAGTVPTASAGSAGAAGAAPATDTRMATTATAPTTASATAPATTGTTTPATAPEATSTTASATAPATTGTTTPATAPAATSTTAPAAADTEPAQEKTLPPRPVTAAEPLVPSPREERPHTASGLPTSFIDGVHCKDELLSVLTRTLPFDVDLSRVLEEDWQVARSVGAVTGTRSKVVFPIRFLRPDGTHIELTLRRISRPVAGKHWTLALVDGDDGTGTLHDAAGLEGAPQGDEGAWQDLSAALLPPYRRVSPLREMAQFCTLGSWTSALGALTGIAAPERWDYPGEGVGRASRFGILREYLCVTLHRLREQDKVAVSADGTFCVANTGLMTSTAEDIYACFTPTHADEATAPWSFEGFAVAGSGELGRRITATFDPLPQPASYIESLDQVMPRQNKLVALDYRAIIGHELDRLPRGFLAEQLEGHDGAAPLLERLFDTSAAIGDRSQALRDLGRVATSDPGLYRRLCLALDDAVSMAMRRVRASFRLCAPAFDPQTNLVDLLLPLSLIQDGQADCALVLEPQPSGNYQATSVLTLPRAYACARVVSKYQPVWLLPEKVLAAAR